MTDSKQIQLALMMVVGWMTTSPLALSDNGGGYNGPDTSGQSIPITLDRAITHSKVRASVNKCFTQLLRDVSVQLFQGESGWSSAKSIQFEFPKDMEPFSDFYNEKTKGELYCRVGTRATDSDPNLYTFSIDVGVSYATHDFLLQGGFPRLTFDQEILGDAVDRLGNLRSDRILLSKLRVQLPKTYGSAVPLWNEKTQRPTAVRVNLVEYVQCLQSEVQQ